MSNTSQIVFFLLCVSEKYLRLKYKCKREKNILKDVAERSEDHVKRIGLDEQVLEKCATNSR